MAITAQEFKDIMLAKGRVKNQQVSEPVLYGIPGPINVPPNMEIINCEIPELHFGYANLTTLKIRDGKIGKLNLNSNSVINQVVINKCEIVDLQLEETVIENIRLVANYPIKIAGRFTSVGTFKIEGNLESLFNNGLRGEQLILDNCALSGINLIDASLQEIKIKNTKCTGISLGYGSGLPTRVEFTNVTTKDASITYAYVRRIFINTEVDQEITIGSLIFKPQ